MKNEITEERLLKYFKITEDAFKIVKNNIILGKEKEAKEILDMANNYINDAHYFKDKDDWVNAFASLNYAHGWIDSGVRLDIFEVGSNNKLFTIK